MKKKVWEFIPATIAFLLIMSILAVMLSIMNQKSSPAGGVPITPVSENEGDPPTSGEDENNTEEIKPYQTEFPKSPQTDEVFIYKQNISGYGNIHIKYLHQTTLGIFAILETDTQFGDISVQNKSVAIAKISPLCVIEKIFVLPSYQDLTYVSSQITVDGLYIMCANKSNMLLFTVDYELNQCSTDCLPLADSGKLFLGSDSCIILTEGTENTVNKKVDGEIITKFLPRGNIVEIYDFHFYLLVFINQDNGYSIIKLSPSLQSVQITFVTASKIKALCPFTENSQQMFFVVEENINGARLWKYDNTFNKNNAISTDFANPQNLLLFPQNDKVVAVFTGSINGIYTINSQLLCAPINNPLLQSVNTIYDYNIYNNGCYLLCKTAEEDLKFINLGFNNNYTSFNIDEEATQNACFVNNINNTCSVFYEKTAENDNTYVNIVCFSYNI